MKRLLVLLVTFVAVVAGCAAAQRVAAADPGRGLPDGASVQNVGDRSYLVYKPPGVTAAAPLVLVLHGLSGTAEYTESTFGWDPIANANKFIVAYPTGIGGSWNTGAGCCGQASADNIDDIGFLTSVVSDVSAKIPIAHNRVYVTGMSNGGLMAYALACNTDTFAAIGAVSATQVGACNPPRPPSVIALHGVNDFIIRYDGGPGLGFAGGMPIPGVDAFWRQANSCGAPTTHNDGAVATSSASCTGSRSVELVTITGGGQDGHVWPPYASQLIWDFFAAHPR